MRMLHGGLAVALLASSTLAQAPPSTKPPVTPAVPRRPDAALQAKRFEQLRFAPMWQPIPRFVENGGRVPAADYAEIWQPAWQKDLAISDEQRQRLEKIRQETLAGAQAMTEQFKKLSPEEQKAEAESWGDKPSPARQRLEAEFRRQIETVLTPQQLRTLQDHTFPVQAVGALYDPPTREKIAFDEQQQETFRRLATQHAEMIQEQSLKVAEQTWALLTAEQKQQMVDVVKRQGPTSATLSLAAELNWNLGAMALAYPLLSEQPVRKRLGLAPKKEQELEKLVAEIAAKANAVNEDGTSPPLHDQGKPEIDAILTPDQLKTLEEIDFRRKVVLALGYPEKQKAIDFTAKQRADLLGIQKVEHERLYGLDREMLAQALKIFTPVQLEQLRAKSDGPTAQ